MSFPATKAPLRVAGAVFAVSAVFAAWLGCRAAEWATAVCAVISLFSLVIPQVRRHRAIPAALLCAVAALSLFVLRDRLVRQPLAAYDGNIVSVTVRVEELPTAASGSGGLTVRVLGGDLPAGTKLLMQKKDCAPQLFDTMDATVRVFLPDSDNLYRAADGIYLFAFPRTVTETGKNAAPWYAIFPRLRQRLIYTVERYLYGEPAALICGVCLGDKSGLSAETSANFRQSGLSHLLCVSGLHVSALAAILSLLFRFLRRKTRSIVVLAAVWGFILLIGAPISAVRAGIFCTVMTAGGFLRGRPDGLSSLGLGFVILYIANPFCIYDLGMQLSFGACFGLMTITPVLFRAVRIGKTAGWLRHTLEAICVAFGATLPLFPITAVSFGNVSILSALSTPIATLPATGILLLGGLGMVCGAVPWLDAVAKAVFFLAGLLARFILWLAETMASWPFACLPINEPWLIFWMAGGLAVILLATYLLKRRGFRLGILAVAVAFAVGIGTQTLLNRNALKVTVLPAGTGVAARLTLNGRDLLVLAGADPTEVRNVYYELRQQGVRHLDALLLYETPPEVVPLLTDRIDTDTVKQPQTRVKLWNAASLTPLDGGFIEIHYGGRRLLLSTGGDVAALREPTADLLVMSGAFPANGDRFAAGRAWMLCSTRDQYEQLSAISADIPIIEDAAVTVTIRQDGTIG